VSVIRRKGTKNWFIEFTYRGVTRRETSTTPDRKKAERIERKWRDEIDETFITGKSNAADKPSLTLGEAVARYYTKVLAHEGAKPRTLAKDRVYLKALVARFGEDRMLNTLEGGELADWRDELLDDHKSASVTRQLGYFLAIRNRARDDWRKDVGPDFKIKMPKQGPDRVVWLTVEQELALENGFDGEAEHAREVVAFLHGSGLRWGEAMALTWSRVRFATCPKTKQERAWVTVVASDAKDSEDRTLPCFLRATAALRWFKALRPDAKPQDRVFQFKDKRTGKVRPFQSIRTAFATACENAGITAETLNSNVGITNYHVHDSRHTFASRCLQAGMALPVVAKLLGHSTTRMTERYAHLCQGNLDEAVALVDPGVIDNAAAEVAA
jgi:integrase